MLLRLLGRGSSRWYFPHGRGFGLVSPGRGSHGPGSWGRDLTASNRASEDRGAELESKVAERTQDLEFAISELETFNQSVSHDLRSPLSAIVNFSTILAEDYRGRPLDGHGLAMLERIRNSATRAADLLDDLLQISGVGRQPISLERIDMAELARESFFHASAAALDSDVEFVLRPLPDAHGDRSLLGNVFVNLFSNALKYSRGKKHRRIVVRGTRGDSDCVYEVQDNGYGFDGHLADRVFGLFQRLEPHRRVEGSGVGLATVSWIVRRHGGRVWATGRPGHGARFCFSLPSPPET